MAERKYRKIAGRGRRSKELFTWNTLWLGPDHLLQIEHTGYAEEYKRFYFRDIQSITIRRNNRALVWTIAFLVMVASGIALVIGAGINAFTLSFTALFALLLLIHLARGSSCITHVKTAVQREELASLRRVPRTEKAMAEIRARIAAAQGTLTPEEVRNLVSARGGHTASVDQQITPSSSRPAESPPS